MGKDLKVLGRQDILEAKDITTQRVEVPEWGGVVLVRSLTGVERDKYEQSVMEMRKTGRKGRGPQQLVPKLQGARARLCVLAIVNEKGEREFKDGEDGLLAEKSAAGLSRVFDMAAAMSGLSDEAIEELLGN